MNSAATNSVCQIRAGSRTIGDGQPCFIAAEIGFNHNGDFALAQDLLHAAAEAGVDAVKFQNYHTEDFLFDRSLTYTYRSQGNEVTESQWDMFKRHEPPSDWLHKLKALADELNIEFFSTPTSNSGVDEIVAAELPLLKMGSDYLTHVPMLEYMSATGIPVIISTGMADVDDIDAAVAALRRGGQSPFMILHCTSAYPTPDDAVNLRQIQSLRARYDLPVGFSDHTTGFAAACQAVSMGACMIEKHFTLDHGLPGPDHWFCCTPGEMADLVTEVRRAEARLGVADLVVADAEAEGRMNYRVSTVARRPIQAGSKLRREDVVFCRPGTGILPVDIEGYLGWYLRRDIPAGDVIAAEDLIEHESD